MPGRTVLVAVGAMLAVAMWSGPAAAQKTEIAAISFVPNNNSFGVPFAEWVEAINKDAAAPIRISLKASGSMSPFTMGNAVKTGAVDLANLPPTFYQNLLPIGDFVKLSRRSLKELRANGAEAFMDELHQRKVNAKYLTTWGIGIPFHLYVTKKIDKPDLKGLRIRITPVYRAFFKALGADVIQTPPHDVYTALERGTIDGYGWPIWDIKSLGWDKVTKYRVDPGFYTTNAALIVNLDRWKSLSASQRAYLQKKAWELADYISATAEERNAHYRKEQAEAGIQVIELKGKDAERYLRAADDSAWEEAMKLDPENAPKLKKLIYD